MDKSFKKEVILSFPASLLPFIFSPYSFAPAAISLKPSKLKVSDDLTTNTKDAFPSVSIQTSLQYLLCRPYSRTHLSPTHCAYCSHHLTESSCPSNLHSSACYHSISCSFIVHSFTGLLSPLAYVLLSLRKSMYSSCLQQLHVCWKFPVYWSSPDLLSLTATYTLYSSLLSVIFF